MTREEAIQALKDLAEINVRYRCDDKWITALDMAIEALKAEPVRCKDCKHIGIIDEDEGTLYYHCCFWARETDGWGFCHKAERREP